MLRPTRLLLAATILAAAAVAVPASVAPTLPFEITLPLAAGVGTDLPSTTPAGLLLRIEGSASFPEVRPGAPTKAALTVRNDAGIPVRLVASASPLAGPEGASIPASAFAVETAGARGSLSSPVEAARLPAGGFATLTFTLTPPGGDVAYVPAGAYRGTLTLRAEAIP